MVNAEAARGDYILEAAQDNIQGFAHALDQQAQRHQKKKQAELQRQRQALSRVAAEELVRERRQRMSALKEVSDQAPLEVFIILGLGLRCVGMAREVMVRVASGVIVCVVGGVML